MNISILDAYTTNPGDLSWDGIAKFGNLRVYDHHDPDLLVRRAQESEILLINKVRIGTAQYKVLPKLKCICLTATGYDNIDTIEADRRGIYVCNASGYGTYAVAQHVWALILALDNRVAEHNQSIKQGEWSYRPWSYNVLATHTLAGKSIGIIGLGKIGSQVAQIAHAMGMYVLAPLRLNTPQITNQDVSYVPIADLVAQSDVISLHTPLNDSTHQMINDAFLGAMKSSAVLVNTGRGGLIDEQALSKHLIAGSIRGAALDVLSTEPPPADHPLIGLDNCIITPHIAWASVESRQGLIDIVVENVRAFIDGAPVNVVNSPA